MYKILRVIRRLIRIVIAFLENVAWILALPSVLLADLSMTLQDIEWKIGLFAEKVRDNK